MYVHVHKNIATYGVVSKQLLNFFTHPFAITNIMMTLC